ncbi:MAG: GNAT family N-acetyltransferase [Cytophagia bacterium]|nr:MAG: GNAT family N-acetyltransferase [Cytophagales bacterium]TAG40897.1 MAG: GNAT family N-acetyltransferase [Cytophagia bacterium]TAG82568.1 MAG: GNAT family N-acetyltransferase [Cytophagales bacterium]
MHIRPALLTDAPALRNLSETTFVDTYAAFNTPENLQLHVAQHFNLSQIERELQQENFAYFVVESENGLVAFAKLVLNHAAKGLENERVVEMERFYVLRAFHGQQVAQQLMDFCCVWATERQFGTIWLGVWEHNPRGIRFYEKMNFTPFGTHIFQLGLDPQTDILVKRRLNHSLNPYI